MSRRVILLAATIAISLTILGVLFTFAQDFDVLRTSASSPYNVVEVGDGHNCTTTSEDGFYIDWDEGDFWFTPVYSYNQAVVSFEWQEGHGPDWYIGGWELPSCDTVEFGACEHTLNGTYGIWYSTVYTCTCPAIEAGTQYTMSFDADSERFWVRNIKIEVDTQQWYTGTPPPPPPPADCNLENYNFNDGLDDWEVGEWVIEGEGGWVGLHGCTDELNSYIAQTVSLTATGPSEYYELSILSRNFFPVDDGTEPLLRWKLNSLIPGDNPAGYQGQEKITTSDYWQLSTWTIRPSNMPAITDTLTIWAARQDLKIDNVCIMFHSGPAETTPVCPPAATYTPNPTYTPLPTPTAVNTATATAWAATATAWATQGPYPTQAPPVCDGGGDEPGWDFIWLAGQIVGFLIAFFEAIFGLLGSVLQPIFDLFGFIVWLLGAAFGLVSALIDLIGSVLQFLLSFLTLSFDILEIIGAFFRALWHIITQPGIDPEFDIPEYFAWPIAAWELLIADTPLELLEPVALGIGSLLMIIWTVRQFSGGET